eukprot:TRINITY_DN58386_c0_g1_i1.p2 TRINITY_DN58386_c0_g1~~TRINITY_DN58386_c0_g1_i1.p2  ORF type:complete len:484 (-),score=287.71 TRINITY_DN58386_c0_g1_i1:1738-3189(-)
MSWADQMEQEKLAEQMAKTSVSSEAKDEETPLPISTYKGLDPRDKDSEVKVEGVSSIYRAAESFEELGLSPNLLKGVYAMNFSYPSKIQAQALPVVLDKKRPNLIAQAHHGSGKTAAYSLSMLSRVDESKNVPQVICLCPTRELARQVLDVVSSLAKYTKIKAFVAVPGMSKAKVTAQVVIGTAGSLLSAIRKKQIVTKAVRMLVLDEADVLVAKDGMSVQTGKLKGSLPKNIQILLFSATFADSVRKFAAKIAPKAAKITVQREKLSLDKIRQFKLVCKNEEDKFEQLTVMFGLLNIGQSIIFTHTVVGAKKLAQRLREQTFQVSLLHGRDMEPKERDRVMDDFRHGRTTVLITTNVLARGIDVLQVNTVVNYDVPLTRNNQPDPETYIHRIGRSGRFGRDGVAINFVHDKRSSDAIDYIARYYKKEIVELPGGDYEKIKEIVEKALQQAAKNIAREAKEEEERQKQQAAKKAAEEGAATTE